MKPKYFTVLLACLFAVFFAVAAIDRARAQADEQPDPLVGKKFRSTEKHEIGKQTRGYWHISFRKGGGYTWDHSDVRSSGRYEFDPKTGKVIGRGAPKADGNARTYEGHYDSKMGVLTWDKKKYQEVKEPR
ncbi:MAG: hypothetical protein HYX68_17585 [Planctomycetes bacterium]|nr:hypothetical protein [Planctomycetota bacterium]